MATTVTIITALIVIAAVIWASRTDKAHRKEIAPATPAIQLITPSDLTPVDKVYTLAEAKTLLKLFLVKTTNADRQLIKDVIDEYAWSHDTEELMLAEEFQSGIDQLKDDLDYLKEEIKDERELLAEMLEEEDDEAERARMVSQTEEHLQPLLERQAKLEAEIERGEWSKKQVRRIYLANFMNRTSGAVQA